jgi:predicted nuclease with TOPRIM domain
MQLQLIFDEVALKAQEAKAIKAELKDSLEQVREYVELTEKAREINERRKALREDIKQKMGSRYAKLEDLNDEMKAEKEMMSDIALTGVSEGNLQNVKDQWGNEYEPVFTVKFRKVR